MAKVPDSPFLTSLAHHAADPFRLLVESVVDYAIYMVDPAGVIASWNPGAERMYGYAASEIVGRHFSVVYPAEDLADGKHEQAWQRAIEDGHFEQERIRVRKDGSRFWAVVTVSDLKDYFGRHAGFSVVTRDVSARRAAEDAVRRERDLSAAILGSLPGVYYMYDQTGRFLRWNARFEEVTEYTAEEIARLHPLDLFDGADKALLAERIAGVFRDGRGEVEADFVSKSGRRTAYYFNGVRADFDGRPCLLGMGIDISARKRTEQAARAADEWLRLAVRAAGVGLWDWDLRTGVVHFSAEWQRQLGYEDGEIGSGYDEWRSRVHPDDLDAAERRIAAYRADPAVGYDVEFRLRHRDGSYRRILSQAAMLFDDRGTPVRMIGSHIDVTTLRRLEGHLRQTQKMEAVGRLAGGVAHDFNNLLTVINGYADLALAALPPDAPARDLVAEVRHAGDRAAALTRQLLTVSRQQVLEPHPLDLNAVIADTERMLRRLIGEDVTLSTRLEGGLGLANVDRGHIEQVLLNLVVNARDAMPTGGHLTIETQRVTLGEAYCQSVGDVPPGEYILLAVSDTGCGMDEATQARVFEPFFTTKEVGKGTGLGLATVHGIVRQSRGHVAVYSEIGRGTSFKVYLPEVRDSADTPRPAAAPTAMPPGRETVLLAEDESTVRALAGHILGSCGYRVLEAPDGKEALAIAAVHDGPIHLLISDVVMPQLSGRALAERFAALRPEVPVLFLSGYTDDAVIRHGVLEAEFAFLQKPFTPSALAQKVRAVLDRSSA